MDIDVFLCVVENVTTTKYSCKALQIDIIAIVIIAYHRRCAVSGEKTLPVLQAAHIKPYAMDGMHEVNNGILLRSDLHTLFDDGYLTITKDLILEVSHRLHEDYGNGKDYYKYHGAKLLITPDNKLQTPSPELLAWHNEHVYLG